MITMKFLKKSIEGTVWATTKLPLRMIVMRVLVVVIMKERLIKMMTMMILVIDNLSKKRRSRIGGSDKFLEMHPKKLY